MFRRAFAVVVFVCIFADVASAQDMALSQVLIDGEGWQQVAEGFKFTEGPAVDAAGNVYFTDIPNDRIHKYDVVTRQVSVFVEPSHKTNGLMFGPDGRLYGCQNGKQAIVAFNAKGEAETIATGVPCNDLVVNRDGGIYVTDPANHRVWYISPERKARVVDEGIDRPNGVILWPDQQTLVVADSGGDKLWTFQITSSGDLRFKQPYYTLAMLPFATRSGADGMTVDSAGRLYCTSQAGLQMFDPTGRLSGVIAKPHKGPLSNVCFAGAKLDTLYATAGDKLFCRKVKSTGVRYVNVETRLTFAAPAAGASTNPQETDADFKVQGEYVGTAEIGSRAQKIGVQVVAQGKGKFIAAMFTGGLPGAGGEKATRVEGTGETTGGKTLLTFTDAKATIVDGVLTLRTDKNPNTGELKRVERTSPTLGQAPPAGAVVLFDGTSADAFQGGRMSDDKLLMEGGMSVQKFGDCTLHVEFRTPYQPEARGQGRGNSGCYLQGRYEVQVLDSFGLLGKNNEAGGIYSIRDPDQNMCFPPLVWQTYDIDFTAARFDAEGKKTHNARLTVRHNGVLVQDNVEAPKTTTAAPVKEDASPGPVYLQNHGNPVRYRNIWLVPRS